MSSAPKVSEIFKAAGEAFNRLGEMTMQLQNQNDRNSKWGEEDMDMLQTAITNFGEDLNKISVRVKNRTATQIRQTLTKQVFEEAGIRVQQVSAQSPNNKITVGAGNHIKVVQQGGHQATIAAAPTTVVHANNGTPLVIQQQSPVAATAVVAGQHLLHQSSPTSSAEVMMTLNRLNAEVDTEEDQLSAADLEFDVETTTG